MSEITELLEQPNGPDLAAVFSRLYPELKRIALARLSTAPGSGLDATSLVHEVFLKLVGSRQIALTSRRHFFACAAKAMRQILTDSWREQSAMKRDPADAVAIDLPASPVPSTTWIDIDRALGELAEIDPALAELVELRFYAGLPMDEIAMLRGASLRTTQRDWERARALLVVRLDAA